ncbi:hypothetical protein [Lactococcus lactis]|jgi:hypothetical protein|uniref:hypothetical protein n=1 Tax=Lactococcus lactis TaxID=1358 RepID=UPI002051961D|nr:hypothetical protein [Lactococcus lactis]WKF73448.1 hypothetical protein QYM42_01410 [Lactococcus lactis]BDH80611.1 hypothetical protein LLL8_02680 [Lactococcus lactis]
MKNENNKTTNIILILLVLIFLVVLSNTLSNSVSSQVPSDESQTVYVNSEGEEKDWVSELQGIPSIAFAKNFEQATEWQIDYQDYMNNVVYDFNNKSWVNNVFNVFDEKVKSPIVEIRQVNNDYWLVSTHVEKLQLELQERK